MAEARGNRSWVLEFGMFHSLVDEGFWHRLSSLKLNELGIDESPIPITGFYAPCSHSQISYPLTLLSESLPTGKGDQSSTMEMTLGNRNRCPVPGILYNTNTKEGFHALDRRSLLKAEAKKIWDDIHSGVAEKDCTVLARFLLITFADLKKWNFHYWFAFPAMKLDPPATLVDLKPASKGLSKGEATSLSEACTEWRNSSTTNGMPFFLICFTSDSSAKIKPLSEWESCQRDNHKILFGFYDPCHLPNGPGWPLRNYLAFIFTRWNLNNVHFFCYRETRGFPDMNLCLIGEAMISAPQDWRDPQHVPSAVGWELNRRQLTPKFITLEKTMDPTRLAISAADLNLKLMRWRALPSLNLNLLSGTKCLLLGAGTLGCQVARMLMAWGVRKITLLDNGRVSMSNPLRQSLYTLDDCLNGGEFKAVAAVNSLKRIYPAVEVEGTIMAIPMPGHPVSVQEEETVLQDCMRLHSLIDSHDVVFLLTDTRESRWLPTLLCANTNRITITAALGFDSFLVMRHGAGPFGSALEDSHILSSEMSKVSLHDKDGGQRLGCYFCNDVVAPIDSTTNRTLDQQCTVTRPGLAPIASALAVELLVGLLHHPLGVYAEGEIASTSDFGSNDQPFGILPHQIRGSLSQFSQMTLIGRSSNSCTACCEKVVSEYRQRGMDFILQAINHPTYLEDLTGLTELKKSANDFILDWDNEEKDDEDEECVEM